MRSKPKSFWVYSDGKTLKEITFEEWQKMIEKDRRKQHDLHLLVRVYSGEVYFRKGNRSIWIRRNQLEEMLRLTK